MVAHGNLSFGQSSADVKTAIFLGVYEPCQKHLIHPLPKCGQLLFCCLGHCHTENLEFLHQLHGLERISQELGYLQQERPKLFVLTLSIPSMVILRLPHSLPTGVCISHLCTCLSMAGTVLDLLRFCTVPSKSTPSSAVTTAFLPEEKHCKCIGAVITQGGFLQMGSKLLVL